MERVIQQIKNIFADPNYRYFLYIENIWKDLLAIEKIEKRVECSVIGGLQCVRIVGLSGQELSIWKYSNMYSLNLFNPNGWFTRLEIHQISPTLSSDFDLENNSY